MRGLSRPFVRTLAACELATLGFIAISSAALPKNSATHPSRNVPASTGTVTTIHVDDNAPLGGDGTTWATALDGIVFPGPCNIDQHALFVRAPADGGNGFGDNPITGADESANDDYGDLHLQPGSAGINAGDPAFVPAPGETDFDGHSRVLCGRVDMGAFEFGVGDHDCNAAIDVSDFPRGIYA